jgi:hypothetical protein
MDVLSHSNRLVYNPATHAISAPSLIAKKSGSKIDTLKQFTQVSTNAVPHANTQVSVSAKAIKTINSMASKGNLTKEQAQVIKGARVEIYKNPNMIVKDKKAFVTFMKSVDDKATLEKLAKPLTDAIIQVATSKDPSWLQETKLLTTILNKCLYTKKMVAPLTTALQYSSQFFNIKLIRAARAMSAVEPALKQVATSTNALRKW